MANLERQQLGNYQLVRLLGEGGSSVVYLGEHIHLRTLATIRVLSTSLTDDEVKEFLTEARVLAQLSHPNILPILDFGVENEIPYIVMGYAPNGTLRQRHPKGSQLPLTTVLSYTRPIADALQYAHDQKVIHRDVKPENMLLSSKDEILLSDFSISSITQSSGMLTRQEVGGTIAYMAPEQIKGEPTPASDQYSLGVVVYEWLSGKLPFRGSFIELATQHALALPPSLREQIPGISPDVEFVVMTALAKDPGQRFKSVHAFANALEQAMGGRPAPILGSAPPANLPSPASSKPDAERAVPGNVPPVYSSYPSYANEATIAPYNTPTLSPPYGTPPILTPSESLLSPPKVGSRRGISRRAILVGLVGIVGLAAAEAVTAITSSRTPQAGTPTPTLPKTLIYPGHSGEVNTVAWSPDGRLIASGSLDTTVQVWDPTNGNGLYTYHGHSDAVFDVAWSPHGQYIASASADSTVQVWDAITGRRVLVYPGHSSAVLAVAWSPDGKRIASSSLDKTVQVWEANTGARLLTYKGHSAEVLAVTWSPDSARIASASADKTVQVWEAATGMNAHTYDNHSAAVTAVNWSPDGKNVASGSVDRTVRVWDAATVGKTFTFTYSGHTDRVNAVAWSPDGKLIASGSADRTVQVWNTVQTFFTYRGHSNWVHAVAWAPLGRRIASASADRTVQVWQVT